MSGKSAVRVALFSTRVTEESSYVEVRSALAADYVRWFEARGYLVVPVPSHTGRPEAYLEIAEPELVVLTGGNNVDPALYGGAGGQSAPPVKSAPGGRNAPGIPQVYPERDRTEYALIRGALERGVPVLGICRGLHTINVYFGGGLTQQVSGHVATEHDLVSDDPILSGVRVNSYHNQAVRGGDLAAPLRALAMSPDGLVEALYHPEEPILAVQWHPERQNRSLDTDLLRLFLNGDLQRGGR